MIPRRVRSHVDRALGDEIDLLLDFPDGRRWAVEIKRGLSPALTRGFHLAREAARPARSFIVYSGRDRYPKAEGVEVVGLQALARDLAALAAA